MIVFGLLLFCACLAGIVAVSRRERATRGAAAETVSLVANGWGVTRDLADGRHEEVAWDEIQEVRVVVLPRGPWQERRRLVLDGGGERGCLIPMDLAEEHGVVAGLAALPRFDFRLLTEVDDRRPGSKTLWERARASS